MSDLLLLRKRLMIFDGFNRQDDMNNLGSADTGQVYLTPISESGPTVPVYGISGNQAYVITEADSSGSFVYIPTGLLDFIISCDVKWVTNASPGLVSRGNGEAIKANTRHYITRLNSTSLALFSWNGASYSSLGSYAFIPVDGHSYNLKVSAIGTIITVYIDEVQAVFANNNTLSGSYVGLRSGNTSSNSAPDKRWDNLKVEVA